MLSDIQLQNILTALRLKDKEILSIGLGTCGLTLLPDSTTAFSKTPVRQKFIAWVPVPLVPLTGV